MLDFGEYLVYVEILFFKYGDKNIGILMFKTCVLFIIRIWCFVELQFECSLFPC